MVYVCYAYLNVLEIAWQKMTKANAYLICVFCVNAFSNQELLRTCACLFVYTYSSAQEMIRQIIKCCLLPNVSFSFRFQQTSGFSAHSEANHELNRKSTTIRTDAGYKILQRTCVCVRWIWACSKFHHQFVCFSTASCFAVRTHFFLFFCSPIDKTQLCQAVKCLCTHFE